MCHALSAWFDSRGSKFVNSGKPSFGEHFYKLARAIEPRWSVPWYNLGLHTKNTGRWSESLRFNQRALELDPTDEAAWWNLGIAATALRNWSEARRAWKGCGIELDDGIGEVRMPAVTACVRLDPSASGEVVWGQRLDPARMAILNVPLPESGHRFNDIVLNDGAANGTRVDSKGNEVPVFDELSMWKVSDYSTFRVTLQVPDDDRADENLVELCGAHQLAVEDWSTIRILCAKCSRGNPGPHTCEAKPLEAGYKRFGFGAKKQEDLSNVLRQWVSSNRGADFDTLELVLPTALH
jgi:tetratricopeptide (TPR) repeat protein